LQKRPGAKSPKFVCSNGLYPKRKQKNIEQGLDKGCKFVYNTHMKYRDPNLVPLYKDLEAIRVIIFFLCITLAICGVILTLKELVS
tara:strand:+ start:786 stop:1043 length:258 start_codon:yes stop_codon:yes gene_type:complete